MAKCKEIEDLLRGVSRQGFDTVRTTRGHWKIRLDGRTVATLPATPGGGGNAVKQIIRREHKKLVAAGYTGGFRW